MKDNKKSIYGMIVVIVVVVLGFVTFNFFNGDKKEAKEQVGMFFDKYENVDESVTDYFTDEYQKDDTFFTDTLSYFAKETSHDVISCEKLEKDTFSVTTKVETLDFKDVMDKSLKKTLDEFGESGVSEHFKDVMLHLDVSDVKHVTNEVNVLIVKNEEGFQIVFDQSLANALMGGMDTYLVEAQKGMN